MKVYKIRNKETGLCFCGVVGRWAEDGKILPLTQAIAYVEYGIKMRNYYGTEFGIDASSVELVELELVETRAIPVAELVIKE